jgi:hypothetical protein
VTALEERWSCAIPSKSPGFLGVFGGIVAQVRTMHSIPVRAAFRPLARFQERSTNMTTFHPQRWIVGFVTLIALAVITSTASAQGFGGRRGGHHGGIHDGHHGGQHGHVHRGGHRSNFGYGGHVHGYRSGIGVYSSGYRGFSVGVGGLNLNFGGYPQWHDTSHLHYHPGSFQRHGNHYDFVPGHYDLHRSGHYHW